MFGTSASIYYYYYYSLRSMALLRFFFLGSCLTQKYHYRQQYVNCGTQNLFTVASFDDFWSVVFSNNIQMNPYPCYTPRGSELNWTRESRKDRRFVMLLCWEDVGIGIFNIYFNSPRKPFSCRIVQHTVCHVNKP